MSKNGKTSGVRIDSGVETVSLGVHDLAFVLPWLEANDTLTVSLRADDFRRALTMATGGPENMSTSQAAKVFGWSTKRWRGWAEQGRVDGATQEANGDWRLPREGCRKRVEEERAAGRYPTRVGQMDSLSVSPRRSARRVSVVPMNRSVRRGPRSRKGM